MNRLALMVVRNIFRVPGLWAGLCKYAKNPDRYTEEEKWALISRIMKLAVKAGNLEMEVTGLENVPVPWPVC